MMRACAFRAQAPALAAKGINRKWASNGNPVLALGMKRMG